jgi:hypothetical protein
MLRKSGPDAVPHLQFARAERSYCGFHNSPKEPTSLSFFDEADEPLTEPRPRRPPGGGGRVPPGGGGRVPPRARRSASEQQQFMIRRAVAGAVLLVVVIVIALGIHGCEVSQRNSALRNYATSVASLVARSTQTGQALFTSLSHGGGAQKLQNAVNQALADARLQLSTANGLSAPDEMKPAQGHLVTVFEMRRDALAAIGNEIQAALSKSGTQAVDRIAAEMGRLYASDVLYKDYAAPEIAAALNGAGITPNAPGGPPISGLQFVDNISWLTPSYVASTLGSSAPTSSSSSTSGSACNSTTCGDAMQSVSVSGTTLTPGATATLTANPPPTFTCTFTNDGQQALTNTVVRVTVKGTSISGHAVQSQTQPGQSYTVQVPLPSAPPTGTHTVTATVEPHPGESPVIHNTQTFTITFH